MNLQKVTLSNGIRLVHHEVSASVAHCGLFIGAGSRDEAEHEHGVAHLIEHTVFKGTIKRNLFQVLNRLENIGADLNAYTSKEETCIHASFLNEYYGRTIELFQDIFFHSIFPEKELEKEKLVVMEEIRSYLDNPSEQIFDDFEELLFSGHPLGRNILGTPRNLKRIKRSDILNFIKRNYQLSEVVFVSVGKIRFKQLVKLVQRNFSLNPVREEPEPRRPFFAGEATHRILKKRSNQVHCILGATAYSFSDDKRFALAVLNNMLGGPVMNSRLSLALRERNGLTYHSESNYTTYSDSGSIMIYFGTDAAQYERALSVVHQELKRIREQKLTIRQLHTIRKQIVGQLALSRESNLNTMLGMGKYFLLQDAYEPLDAIIRKVESVTAEQLIDVANEIFAPERLSMLTYKP